MSQEVRSLEPKILWNHFEDLNAVPRPSKKEERVTAFMKAFGESLGLETLVDDIGNVLIRKPASPGMEDRKPVILQGHIDMVHQKNSDTDFDFDTMGIRSYVDGDWVKAEGTTLGSDNGIGVAAAMSILSSTDVKHGPIEGLFTVDEETGMTGAFALQKNWCQGEILLNMDYEDEGELCIGCAGGIDTNISAKYAEENLDASMKSYKITVKGLKGGHSGVEINLQRGNSNKIMTRLIWEAERKFDLRLAEFDGGSLRNAIPREAFAKIAVPSEHVAAFETFISDYEKIVKEDLKSTDPNASVTCESISESLKAMAQTDQKAWINALYANPNGVFKMSNDIDGHVETSTNLSRVQIKDGEIVILCLTRSSVEEAKMDCAQMIEAAYGHLNAEVEHGGDYPGWTPNPNSDILETCKSIYSEKFGKVPEVTAIHAGLECGIISQSHPNLDMIAFGPTIRNPHSPDEMVNIETVQKFWKFLLDILKEIARKN